MQTISSLLQGKTWPMTFITLHTAITATGLEYILEGPTPVTLFAPTDEAFNQLHQGQLFDLLRNVSLLRRLLEYHIVPLKLTQGELMTMAAPLSQNANSSPSQENQGRAQTIELPTLSDHILHVTFSNSLRVQNASVLEPGLEADNGIVYPLEHILWPPDISEASFVGQSESSAHYSD
jgi:uncharacterized surface protein with fasciclin (FAS1) repeats